jgi:hypothetical protein
MATKTAAPKKPVPTYQLKVELAGIKPPIWRRILVPAAITLPKLHLVIQAAMGWSNSHLHEFEFLGERYGEPDPDWDMSDGPISEARVKLNKALQGATSFKYTYDFGDDWVHKVKVEKVFDIDLGFALPLCIDGVRACPPEDVGGQQGYLDFVEAILDPSHAEHESTLEWHGGPFDPNEFETGLANLRLSRSSSLI